jgi:hypothetical protein
MDDFRNKVIVKGSRVKVENICHRVDRVLYRLFLQSSELELPHPLTRKQVRPSPFGSGWGDTLACARGVGRSQL